ncbi:MAG: hypothetical protein LUC88_03880 [Prevotella sp.]|nr:hypothetical protein [Prevotella sp.]
MASSMATADNNKHIAMGKRTLHIVNNKNTNNYFDIYSPLDIPVTKMATACLLALNGGTATQFMARQYGVKERHPRSNNDLDFTTIPKNPMLPFFRDFLIEKGFEPVKMGDGEYLMNYANDKVGIEVDIMISWEKGLLGNFFMQGNILLCDPCFIFTSKLQRIFSGFSSLKKDSDIQDINTLYDIIEKRNNIEHLQDMIAEKVPDVDIDTLNDMLQE